MNKQQLAQQIVDQIYENTQQDISGDVLQGVLLNMLSLMSDGTAFGGIVNPASYPLNDENVFYLFLEAGNYTNFDLLISDNSIKLGIIQYNDSTESYYYTALYTSNPFKGWFDTLLALQALYPTPSVGDYAYIPDTSPDTTIAIYRCATAGVWADSGLKVDDSNVQTFAGGQQVNEVHIVNDVHTGGNEDVLAAQQGVVLALQNAFLTCSTASATAAKEISATGFVILNGGSIKVKFTYANTAANPTLNINSTGAKAILYNGAVASSDNSWSAGEVVEFYYDPTYNSNDGAWVGTPVLHIVNDLTTGGVNNVLSAEQGKEIKNLLNNNFFIGKGQTLSETYFTSFIPGNTYFILFQNPLWDKTGVTNYSVFTIDSDDASDVRTNLVVVTYPNVVNSYYQFTVPNDSVKIRIAGRAAVGTKVQYTIVNADRTFYDCFEISNIDNITVMGSYIRKAGEGGTQGILMVYNYGETIRQLLLDANPPYLKARSYNGVTWSDWSNVIPPEKFGTFTLGSESSVLTDGLYLSSTNDLLKVTSGSNNLKMQELTLFNSNGGVNQLKFRKSYDSGATWTDWFSDKSDLGYQICSLYKSKNQGNTDYLVNLYGGKVYRFECFAGSGQFGITLKKTDSSATTIKLYDIEGRLVSDGEIVNCLTSGTYLFYVSEDITRVRLLNISTDDLTVQIYDASELENTVFYLKNKEIKNYKVCQLNKFFPKLLPHYSLATSQERMSQYINGLYAVSNFSQIFDFSDGNMTHDSTLHIIDGYAYLVYTYDSGHSDNASSPTSQVRLKKVNISDTSDASTIIIAQKDSTYGTFVQTGGAGSPTAYYDSNAGLLHIIYAANVDNAYIEMHTTFNIATSEVGTYDKLTLNNELLNNTLLGTLFGNAVADNVFNKLQMNCTIGVNNGVYYGGMVYGDGTGNAMIISSTDFINWTLVTTVDFDCESAYELAVWCYNGYLYCIKRLPYPKNDVGNSASAINGNNEVLSPLAKYDIANKIWVSAVAVKNCCTRPTFFEYNNKLYLLTNGPTRNDGQLIEVNTDKLEYSKIIADFNDYVFQYPTVNVYNDTIYLAGTRTEASLPLYVLVFNHYTQTNINNKFLNLMN